MMLKDTDGRPFKLERKHFIGRMLPNGDYEPPYWLGLTLSWLIFVWIPLAVIVGMWLLIGLLIQAAF